MRSFPADALPEVLEGPSDVVILDVREPDEFADWHIPGAVNLPLGELSARQEELPAGADVIAVCAVGERAATAAVILERAGVRVAVLDGGMRAWANTYDDASVTVGDATVLQVRRRGKGCLSYLVGAGDAAIAIDPSADVDQYLTRATAHGWIISHVVDTHLHADHLSGARALAAATDASLILNPADGFAFPHLPLVDGMQLEIARDVALTVSVLAAPGHTRGSTAFSLGSSAVFTGDVLFLESVGRPDLADKAEEFAHQLYRSLHDKILTLRDDTLVFPAHYGAVVTVHAHKTVTATLGELRARLWQLDASEEAFVAWASKTATLRPPNYAEIVTANQLGTTLPSATRVELESGPNRCAVAS